MVYFPEGLEKSLNTLVIPNHSSSVPADGSTASSSEAGSSTPVGQSIALNSTNVHMPIENEGTSAMESTAGSTKLLKPALNACKPPVDGTTCGVAQKPPLQINFQVGPASVRSQAPENKALHPILKPRSGMAKPRRHVTFSSGRSCAKQFGKPNIESGPKPGLVPLNIGSSLDLTQIRPNTSHATNQKPMDPRLKHFLTAAPSLLVGDLPAAAQEFFSTSQATIANYRDEMKQIRTLIDTADEEVHFVNSRITQVISSVIDIDQCIQADANQHMETERKCLRKASLRHIQLIFDAIRSNLDVPFKAKDHALMQIKDTVDLASLAAQGSFKMLEAASQDLAYLEGISSNYTLESMDMFLHLQMCRVADRAVKVLSKSQGLARAVGIDITHLNQESLGYFSISNLYKPKDLTFHPTLYEISQQDELKTLPS